MLSKVNSVGCGVYWLPFIYLRLGFGGYVVLLVFCICLIVAYFGVAGFWLRLA